MILFKRVKKPKKIWAFLFLTILSQPSRADFYSEQVEPVQARAFDTTSQKLILSGFASMWLAQAQDSQARHQWQDNQSLPSETADYGDNFGRYAIGPLIALGQLYWDRENGLSHARALIYTGAVTQVLKQSIQRRRPNHSDNFSMPSGHTSSAFATATALTYSYGLKAGVVMYPLATFVAMTRMADDMHWFSDTVAGAFIGIWLGRASSYSSSAQSGEKAFHYQWMPVVQTRYQGLNLQIEF